ncbi:MAG: hypothetical protein QOD03_1509 [Verrucomicrobiota bacterium]|jgi:hypothetical protein
MSDIIKIIFFSAGFSAVFSGAIIWLFKNWISERLKNSIAYEYAEKLKAVEHGYNQQLEKLRVQLQSESFKAKEEMEHDRKIFERLVSYCDETTFRDACVTIGDYQFYDYENYKRARDLEHYGVQDENQFVNQALREAFQKFHKSLDKFTTIVATNFFGTSENRYMLYPELRHSGEADERERFEEARIETRDASRETLEAFSNFRQTVKQTLLV